MYTAGLPGRPGSLLRVKIALFERAADGMPEPRIVGPGREGKGLWRLDEGMGVAEECGEGYILLPIVQRVC